MSQHKTFFLGICSLILFLLVPSVFASNLYVESSQGNIISVIPFKYNEYYRERFYFGVSQGIQGPRLLFENRIVLNLNPETNQIFILEDVDYSRNYVLEINGEQEIISFCNNNGVCESCPQGSCENIENFLTCPEDCLSGSEDGYCDLQKDGVCDPDCSYYDFDCEECVDNVCLYDGIKSELTTCSEFGGVHCSASKICSGYLTYADDIGTFCCVGSCFEKTTSSEEIAREQSLVNQGSNSVNNQDSSFNGDNQTIFLIIILAIFLVIATIVVVVSESKKIAEEHKIRKYVYDLVRSGYSIPQVESVLLQQNIEKPTIDRILRKYKK